MTMIIILKLLIKNQARK